MKKGFLSRKNQSLFDTTVQMKDVEMGHVMLNLDKSAIPESGTAKVRSRPTVNYFNSHTNSDAAHGFAVPTPKVPVLPQFNGPQTNGTGSNLALHNGSLISVVEDEGEIFIPPPPVGAAPPPPPQFIPPSPTYIRPPSLYGDFEVPPELASLQPPPMPAPKPPTVAQTQDVDFASLKPPSMPPPKPPSDTSSTNSAKASLPIYTSLSDTSDVPECPQFTPPPPPVVKQQPPPGPQKTSKAPPPKPVRMSSMPILDVPSSLNSNSAPVPSSFNPQNTAKIYSIPKSTLLSRGQDRDVRPKSILLLEDSSGDSVRVHVNGNGSTTPSPAETPLPPAKPARRASTNTQLENDLKDLKDNLTATLPGQANNAVPSSTPKTQITPTHVPTPPVPTHIPTPPVPTHIQTAPMPTQIQTAPMPTQIQTAPMPTHIQTAPMPTHIQTLPKPASTPPKVSPKLQKVLAAPAPTKESNPPQLQADTQEKPRQYSPLLTHKLNTLKASESSGAKESSTSPLALLKAAKERERQRTELSRQNSNKSSQSLELPAQATIQPSESNPNSFTVIPKSSSSSSSSSLVNVQERLPIEKPNLHAQAAVPAQPKAPVQVTPPPTRAPVAKQEPKSPAPSTASSNSLSNIQKQVLANQDTNPVPASSEAEDQENGGDFGIPFIPPPPEFANSDGEDGDSPPGTPPPDPPTKFTIPPAPAQPAPAPPVVRPPAPPPTAAPTQPPARAVVAPIPPRPKVAPPPPPTTQPPAPPVVRPPAPPPSTAAPTQPPAPKVVPPPPPTTQPPAPKVVPPPPPTTQPPAPKVVPPPPTTQPPAPKVVPPPTTQPPAPKVVPPPPPSAAAPTQPTAPKVVPPPAPPPPAAPPINPATTTAQKPRPPTAARLVPSESELKAKLAQRTKPKLPENLPSTPTSANQATLLSILQKKMLEMDPKLSVPVKEADNGTDDWGTAQSDEEEGIPVPPKPSPKAQSATLPPQTSRGLDMRELETKVGQKAAGNVHVAGAKSPASNGSSKQSYGMTFMVRPGTKQPITVVSKGNS